jgi:alpha-tubulin suppressor-like RCC1 family protein
LGLGDEKDTYAPYKMEPFSESKIVQVAAGGHHSAAINEDGEVFTWGWSGSLWKLGGLGHGRGKLGYLGYGIPENIKRPKKVEGLSGVKIVQIACGHHHTLALSDEGEIYSWGRGDWGRLGHGNNASVYTPLKIDPVQFQGQKIVKIAAGKQYSGAITEEGDLFMWGKNEQFQLGVQSMQNYLSGGAWDCYTSPIMLIIKDKRGEPYQIKEVACGEKVTSAITEDGKGYIWGGTIFEPEQFGGEVKFSAISCGRLHMGAVSKNKLYMYGSNWSNQLGDLKHTFVPPSNVEEEAHILEFPGKLIQFDCGGDYSAVLIEI